MEQNMTAAPGFGLQWPSSVKVDFSLYMHAVNSILDGIGDSWWESYNVQNKGIKVKQEFVWVLQRQQGSMVSVSA